MVANAGGKGFGRLPPGPRCIALRSLGPALFKGTYGFERAAALQAILADAEGLCLRRGRGSLDRRVARAFRRVPREAFLASDLLGRAYEDRALPIGSGQTISQPSLVAFMTDLAAVEPTDRVLEVGTGSGYQTAILAELVARVFSVEVLADFAKVAGDRLARLGYTNVELKTGDGRAGWPERAPFDAIVVTAAAPSVPEPLIEQLVPGGRLVIPVKTRRGQELQLVQTAEDGSVSRRSVLPVMFVPLV